MKEEEEDHLGYSNIQNLPLDETVQWEDLQGISNSDPFFSVSDFFSFQVDLFAKEFYGRRLCPLVPARLNADCPTQSMFDKLPKYQELVSVFYPQWSFDNNL